MQWRTGHNLLWVRDKRHRYMSSQKLSLGCIKSQSGGWKFYWKEESLLKELNSTLTMGAFLRLLRNLGIWLYSRRNYIVKYTTSFTISDMGVNKDFVFESVLKKAKMVGNLWVKFCSLDQETYWHLLAAYQKGLLISESKYKCVKIHLSHKALDGI